MMNCAHCQAQIDADSLFCDQCGKEVFICTECGQPGIGKRCIHDGKPLRAAQAAPTALPVVPPTPVGLSTAPPVTAVASPAEPLGAAQVANPAAPAGLLTLTLVNNSLNLRVPVQPGDIIGRNQGQHTAIFGQYVQVSSRHAQFSYDPSRNVWQVTDLNSTNHTRLGMPPNWSAVAPLLPNQPAQLQPGQYLLLAHIEFIIQIEGGAAPLGQAMTPTGTVRVL